MDEASPVCREYQKTGAHGPKPAPALLWNYKALHTSSQKLSTSVISFVCPCKVRTQNLCTNTWVRNGCSLSVYVAMIVYKNTLHITLPEKYFTKFNVATRKTLKTRMLIWTNLRMMQVLSVFRFIIHVHVRVKSRLPEIFLHGTYC